MMAKPQTPIASADQIAWLDLARRLREKLTHVAARSDLPESTIDAICECARKVLGFMELAATYDYRLDAATDGKWHDDAGGDQS